MLPSRSVKKRSTLLKQTSGPWRPKFVDYFAVCGLGLETHELETEGRFHSGKVRSREQFVAPITPDLIDRYPAEDYAKFELPRMLSSCVLPYGVRLYEHGEDPFLPETMPKLYPLILTDTKGTKVYVAVLSFRDRVGPVLARLHRVSADWYADKCICLVSHFPFLGTFQQILEEIHRLCFHEDGCPQPLWDIIADLINIPIPSADDTSIIFNIVHAPFSVTLPDPTSPRSPHVTFLPLVESLDVDSIIQLFTAVLMEQKILLVGCNLKMLTLVAEAVLALIWPLKWTPIYVPVLPVEALECLDAPVNFLYGVCSDCVEIKTEELDGVVVADLDHSVVKLVTASTQPDSNFRIDDGDKLEPPDGSPRVEPIRSSRSRSVQGSPTVQRLPTWTMRKLKLVSRRRDIRNQTGTWLELEDERGEGFLHTIPELPEEPGSKLRKTLCHLIRPNVSTLTSVRHALTIQEQTDVDLLLGLSGTRWGPRHDERFQLAFVHFMASVLKGYKDYMVETEPDHLDRSQSLHELIHASAFLAAKKMELGWEGENFLKQIMATQAWPSFLMEHLTVGKEQHSLLDDFILALSTSQDQRLTFPEPKPISNFITIGPAADVANGSAADMANGPPAPIVHTEFPESPASSLQEVRRQMQEAVISRMDTIAEQEHRSQLELMKLDYMARLCYHFDALSEKPHDEEVKHELKTLIERGEDNPMITDWFIETIQQRYQDVHDFKELDGKHFMACKELMALGLDILAREENFGAAAVVVDLAKRLYKKEKNGDRVHMHRQLKQLKLWHIPEFWATLFENGVERIQMEEEEDFIPDLRMHVLRQLVKVMAEVGLREAELSDLLDSVAGGLSVKRQIMLRDQFAQLQVLLNPIAKRFIASMSTTEGRPQTPERTLSRGAERWKKAVALVKERIQKGEHIS